MRKLLLITLTVLIPLFCFSQAVPGCGTFTSSGPITATSNTTISGKSIDLGGAATIGINIPNGVHDVHVTKCIIKNGTTANGLLKIGSGCYNITVDTCFFEAGWRGINAVGATNNIHIWYNYFHNINDPNVTATSSDGGGSSVQLNGCNGTSIQILDNKSYHDVSGPGIGDQFSLYKCNGTAASPIRACRNQCLNGSNNPPGTGYVGMVGGDVSGSWQRCDSNIFVNCGSVCAQIQSGQNIEMSYNTGFLAQTSYTSVGMAFGNYSNPFVPASNITMAFNNVRCIQASGNVFNYWFDPNNAFAPAGWSSNTTSTSLNANILPNPLWPPCSSTPSPPVITYNPQANVYTDGIVISSLVPTNTGGNATSYSVSPALPTGLGINTTSGIISGTPTTVTAAQNYVVTASNSGGNGTFTLNIQTKAPVVNKPVISYSPNSATTIVGTGIATLTPSNTGSPVVTWGISPTLPTGLTFNSGVISGIPLVTLPSTNFTVSATNSGGTGMATVNLTVNPQPPLAPNISYPASSYVLTQNTSVTLTPSNVGGVGSYSVTSGVLPAGLTLSSSTGVITGSCTTLQAPGNVTITCSNGTGSSPYTISFAVNASPTQHWYILNGVWFGPVMQ